MVGIVSYLGIKIDEPSTDNWRYIGKPFLIGTVALGGAINVMPVIYSKVY